MEDLPLQVAHNLKRIREEKKLSLEKLAELTGVSKSMLGQIERGDSSPTIATVWKIASGLKVSFTTLLQAPQPDTRLVPRAEVRPMAADDGRYRLYPLFPIDEGRRFEVYTVEIEPGGALSAEGHPEGTQEFLTVFAGELTLQVDDETFTAAAGDAIRFRADRPHRYRNAGKALTKLSMTIGYT